MKEGTCMKVEHFTNVIDKDLELYIDGIICENEIWFSQNEISNFFQMDNFIITKYIQDYLDEVNQDENNFFSTLKIDTTIYYDQDIIIALSYRINSKNSIAFRKWIKSVLNRQTFDKKNNLLLHNNLSNERVENDLNDLLTTYEKGLKILDDYDHNTFPFKNGHEGTYILEYDECIEVIRKSTFNDKSDHFAVERDDSFKSSISVIYQTFDGNEIYPTIEEKAAQLLYLITKNHSFIDGNKRIAALIFLYFLMKNDCLRINEELVVSNEVIAYLTILIATSRPEDNSIVTDLIKNLITL